MNNDPHSVVKYIFNDLYKPIRVITTKDELNFLVHVIPNSSFSYEEINYSNPKYWKIVLSSGKLGKTMEDKGMQLWAITDDENIVHWIAFNKEYESYAKKLQNVFTNNDYLKPFNSIDEIKGASWEIKHK